MEGLIRARRMRLGLAVCIAVFALALPTSAVAEGGAATTSVCSSPRGAALPDPCASVGIAIKGNPAQLGVLSTAQVEGAINAPAPGEEVTVRVYVGTRKVETATLDTDPSTGEFSWQFVVESCCNYSVRAQWGSELSNRVGFTVLVPRRLGVGPKAKYFNDLLRQAGYHQKGKPRKVNWATRLALIAFRKVNRMRWSSRYSPRIYRMLLQGKGRFRPKHPKDGRHVEVDISRQVMALVRRGKAVHVFHVSTGASSSPTPTGRWRFYLRQPGYNGKLMYYSVYYNGNYATHGFNPVPLYNASHGCTRNPIPYSIFIYRWIQLGMPIWVYQ